MSTIEVPPVTSSSTNEPEANKLFRMVMKHKGSDLHLKVGLPPCMRLGGILRQISVGRQHDRHRLSHIGHFAIGEREGPAAIERGAGIRRPHHPAPRHCGRDIFEREHGEDARQRLRRRGADGADQRMRMRAANEGGVKRVHNRDIVHEAAASGEQRVVFEPRQT